MTRASIANARKHACPWAARTQQARHDMSLCVCLCACVCVCVCVLLFFCVCLATNARKLRRTSLGWSYVAHDADSPAWMQIRPFDLSPAQDWDEMRLLVRQLAGGNHPVHVLMAPELSQVLDTQSASQVGLSVDHAPRAEVAGAGFVCCSTDLKRLPAAQNESKPLRFENKNAQRSERVWFRIHSVRCELGSHHMPDTRFDSETKND